MLKPHSKSNRHALFMARRASLLQASYFKFVCRSSN
jgi:hypothetical protein